MGMASGTESKDVPAAVFRSAVWDHFACRVTYDDGGNKVVDKSATVCKHCATRVVYADSNTSNMSAHLRRHHPSQIIGSTRRSGRGSTATSTPRSS